jgi:hypothetical protein
MEMACSACNLSGAGLPDIPDSKSAMIATNFIARTARRADMIPEFLSPMRW